MDADTKAAIEKLTEAVDRLTKEVEALRPVVNNTVVATVPLDGLEDPLLDAFRKPTADEMARAMQQGVD